MSDPKLTVGAAMLWHKGAWVEAITDEAARETSKFVRWEHSPHPDVRTERRRTSDFEQGGIAHYEDTNGRKWMQRTFWNRGIMQPMVVKVELQSDEKAHVCMISNKDGSLRMTMTPTSPLLARMQKSKKRFFQADVANQVVELGDMIPDQDW